MPSQVTKSRTFQRASWEERLFEKRSHSGGLLLKGAPQEQLEVLLSTGALCPYWPWRFWVLFADWYPHLWNDNDRYWPSNGATQAEVPCWQIQLSELPGDQERQRTGEFPKQASFNRHENEAVLILTQKRPPDVNQSVIFLSLSLPPPARGWRVSPKGSLKAWSPGWCYWKALCSLEEMEPCGRSLVTGDMPVKRTVGTRSPLSCCFLGHEGGGLHTTCCCQNVAALARGLKHGATWS